MTGQRAFSASFSRRFNSRSTASRMNCAVPLSPTSARICLGFAERNGFGRIIVGNKFAYRATEVNELRTVRDPIGPENDSHLQAMIAEADCVVAGWGQLAKLPEVLRSRWKDIVRLCDAAGRELHAIGTNADRHPKHPLMTAYAEGIAPWAAAWFAGRGAPSVIGENGQ